MFGKVKFFSVEKGYGFITPDNSSEDVFVHFSSIVMDGYKALTKGDDVEFHIVSGEKGKQAANVKKL